jgi:predicted SnoaL-like aldol condensation-catalyzing enzyme
MGTIENWLGNKRIVTISNKKAKIRRVIEEVINKGNMAVVDEVMASNYVYHNPEMEVKGPEGFKQFVTMMRTASPTCILPLAIWSPRRTQWRLVS